MIRPTNPTSPLRLTAIAVINAANPKATNLVFTVSTPRPFASSSPRVRTFNLCEIQNKANIPARIQTALRPSTEMLFSVMLPISQNNVEWTCSLLAMDVKNIITAEKKALITTPASSRFITCDLPVKCPIPQTSQTVPSAPANAKTATGEPPQNPQVTPDIIAVITPRPAPLDIPRI